MAFISIMKSNKMIWRTTFTLMKVYFVCQQEEVMSKIASPDWHVSCNGLTVIWQSTSDSLMTIVITNSYYSFTFLYYQTCKTINTYFEVYIINE